MSLPRSRWLDPVRLDRYAVDILLPDIVGHDRQPTAFLVWLWLSAQADGNGRVEVGLRGIAEGTGLSKSAVQLAVALLERRGLLVRESRPAPLPARYGMRRPWAARATRRVKDAPPATRASATPPGGRRIRGGAAPRSAGGRRREPT